MIDPLTLGVCAALYLTFKKQTAKAFGVMTPEREELYRNACEFLHDPTALRSLADDFEKEGCKVQATMLRKRAEWRTRSEELKAKHQEVFTKAMASENVHAILQIAEEFEKMTATANAKKLRARAKEVYDVNEQKKEAERKAAITKETAPKTNGAAKAETIPRNTSAEQEAES